MWAIGRFFRNAFDWFKQLISTEDPPPTETPVKRPRKKRKKSKSGLKQLLDDLDFTFQAYYFLQPKNSEFRRVVKAHGVTMATLSENYYSDSKLHDSDGVYINHLENVETYGLPSILTGLVPHSPSGDRVHWFFVGIKKKMPWWFRRKNCVTYECCATLSEKGFPPFDWIFYIDVNVVTGEVQARYHLYDANFTRDRYVKGRQWMVPRLPCIDSTGSNEEIAVHYFCMFFNLISRREYGTNITVKRGKDKVTFCVPENEWKEFFKDRIKVKTENGSSKRIFHAVAAHKRMTDNGDTYVKTHYRGLRYFRWNNYEVSIVIPERHGAALSSFGITAISAKEKGKVVELDDKNIVDALERVHGITRGAA